MTKEQIEQVENMVNEIIDQKLPITVEEMTVEEAKNLGAIGLFGDKYGDKVKVYSMGDFSQRNLRRPTCRQYRKACKV